METRKVMGKKRIWNWKKWAPRESFFEIELFPSIFYDYCFSIFKHLLILTMLITETCLWF